MFEVLNPEKLKHCAKGQENSESKKWKKQLAKLKKSRNYKQKESTIAIEVLLKGDRTYDDNKKPKNSEINYYYCNGFTICLNVIPDLTSLTKVTDFMV